MPQRWMFRDSEPGELKFTSSDGCVLSFTKGFDMNKKLLLAVLILLLTVFSLSAKIGLSVKLGGAYDLMKGKTTTSGFEDSFFYLPVECSGKGIGIDASLGFDFTKRLGIYADFTSVSAQEIRYKSDILGDLVVKKDVITFDGEPLKGAIVQLMAEVHTRGGVLYKLTPDSDLDIRVGGGFSFCRGDGRCSWGRIRLRIGGSAALRTFCDNGTCVRSSSALCGCAFRA